jgi:hypothetical protein
MRSYGRPRPCGRGHGRGEPGQQDYLSVTFDAAIRVLPEMIVTAAGM